MSAHAAADRAARVELTPVKPVHRDGSETVEAVKDLHRSKETGIEFGKVRVGAAVRRAIGTHPLKRFGHEGLMSDVCSGEKTPEYLARIYLDRGARRRFALAFLEDDTDVVITTTITVPQEERAS